MVGRSQEHTEVEMNDVNTKLSQASLHNFHDMI